MINNTPPVGDSRFQIAIKTAIETVNNSNTLQDDNELKLPVAANTWYVILLNIILQVVTNAPDLKSGWSAPAGSVFSWDKMDFDSLVAVKALGDTDAAYFFAPVAGGVYTGAYIGYLLTGGTAGTLQYRWSQNTATVEDTSILAGSVIQSWRQ